MILCIYMEVTPDLSLPNSRRPEFSRRRYFFSYSVVARYAFALVYSQI